MAASSKMVGRPPNMKGLLEPSVIRWHYSLKIYFFNSGGVVFLGHPSTNTVITIFCPYKLFYPTEGMSFATSFFFPVNYNINHMFPPYSSLFFVCRGQVFLYFTFYGITKLCRCTTCSVLGNDPISNSGIWLSYSYRPASLARRACTTSLCQSRLYPPSQGLRICPLYLYEGSSSLANNQLHNLLEKVE